MLNKNLPLSFRNIPNSVASLMHRNIALVAEQDLVAFIHRPTEANLTNNVILEVECVLKHLMSVMIHEKECISTSSSGSSLVKSFTGSIVDIQT